MSNKPSSDGVQGRPSKHSCSRPSDAAGLKNGGNGAAIEECIETAEGLYSVDNGEYGSFVSFCPFCGSPAPLKPEDVPEPALLAVGGKVSLPSWLTSFQLNLVLQHGLEPFVAAVSDNRPLQACYFNQVSIFDGAVVNDWNPAAHHVGGNAMLSFRVDLSKLPQQVSKLVVIAATVDLSAITVGSAFSNAVELDTVNVRIAKSVVTTDSNQLLTRVDSYSSVVVAVIERAGDGWTFSSPWVFQADDIHAAMRRYGAE